MAQKLSKKLELKTDCLNASISRSASFLILQLLKLSIVLSREKAQIYTASSFVATFISH